MPGNDNPSCVRFEGSNANFVDQMQYAIPKINMLRNLMMFQNEVKAAVQ